MGGIIYAILIGGLVGGAVGNWVFGILDIHIGSGIVGDLVTGVIGAIIVVFIAGLFKK